VWYDGIWDRKRGMWESYGWLFHVEKKEIVEKQNWEILTSENKSDIEVTNVHPSGYE
jgi:hypothetical protein